MRVFVDGEEGGLVDPLDRGLQYGDGLFETIAVLNGRPRLLEWHLERLAEGARRLGFPAIDTGLLNREVARASSAPRCVVKLVLTRGTGERGYRPPAHAVPRLIVASWNWPSAVAPDRAGARVDWCRTRLGRNPRLAGIKHMNRLEQVLARAEWEPGEWDEGLMCDDGDNVIAATQANLVARIGGRWVTPRLDQCGVAGVMRRAFLAWLARQGADFEERALSRAEIESATALVLTNALVGAWPVRLLAGRSLAMDPAAPEFNAWLARS
jgi:4-amino-4-deoxychorismate lyase